MRVKVCKYGGSSLATPEKLEEVARQVVDQHRTGYATAVVVSAMGETTDELLGLAQGVSEDPNLRELDVLLSAGERISTALLALAVGELGVGGFTADPRVVETARPLDTISYEEMLELARHGAAVLDRIDAAARVLHGELVEPVLERRGAPA